MEDNSPYQAGRAATETTDEARLRANRLPHDIGGPVKHMWIMGVVIAGFTVLSSLAALRPLSEEYRNGNLALLVLGVTAALMLLDAAIYLGLSWGVRRYSRAAACAMVGYYWLGQLLMISTGQRALTAGLGMMVIVSFVLIRGTLATFAYHRHMAQELRRPPRGRLSDDPAFASKADTAP
jgi:hypothetical protein